MFGVIIAGRLVQTDMQQVGERQFIFNISDADTVNHIVVFMTGQTPFPDTMGGAVHFSWPQTQGTSWHLLGLITNQKPSAIFKIANLKKEAGDTSTVFGQSSIVQCQVAQIGISVEPLDQLAQQTPASNTIPSTLDTFVQFSSKMLENFYNYASSFAVTQAQMTPNPSETFVPISTLHNWFSNFQRKMQQNPNFWKS